MEGKILPQETMGKIRKFLVSHGLPYPVWCGEERFTSCHDAKFESGMVREYGFDI